MYANVCGVVEGEHRHATGELGSRVLVSHDMPKRGSEEGTHPAWPAEVGSQPLGGHARLLLTIPKVGLVQVLMGGRAQSNAAVPMMTRPPEVEGLLRTSHMSNISSSPLLSRPHGVPGTSRRLGKIQ